MRILFVTDFLPHEQSDQGGAKVIDWYMRELRARDNEVSLLALCQPKDAPFASEVSERWVNTRVIQVGHTPARRIRSVLGAMFQTSARSYCLSAGMPRHAGKLLSSHDFDLIHIFHPSLIRIVSDALPRARRPRTRLIGDVHDVSRIVLRRKIRAQPTIRGLLDLYWTTRSEYADYALADGLLVYSDVDAADLASHVRPMVPMHRLKMWFDAIGNIRSGIGPRTLGRELLVVGTSADPRMRAGTEWLLDRVWPSVVARFPGAMLRLVSVRPEHQAKWASVPGVVPLPYVDDLIDLYDRSAALLFPLQSGGFTRHLKLLNAMARGCPVVLTPEANTSEQLVGGVEAAVCASPEAFVEAITRLFLDASYGASLAEAALHHIHREYGETYIIRDLLKAYEHNHEREHIT